MRAFLVAGVFLTVLAVKTAEAALFCVVGMAVPPQCMYDDVRTCVEASSPPNTYCGVNPDATLMQHGSQRYCAVSADRLAQCRYATFGECAADTRDRAVCVDRGGGDSSSPYRYDRRIQE